VADWTVFGLWWTLERRITKILREIYPKMQKRYKTLYSKINAAMVSTSDKVKELVEILELTPLQIDLVELALQKSNDDEVRSNIFFFRACKFPFVRSVLSGTFSPQYTFPYTPPLCKCDVLRGHLYE
jgi:hypothetical protein